MTLAMAWHATRARSDIRASPDSIISFLFITQLRSCLRDMQASLTSMGTCVPWLSSVSHKESVAKQSWDAALAVRRLVCLATAGSDGGKDLRALLEDAIINVVAETVEHAHGSEERVGKGGGNNSCVEGGLDAVDNDISLEGVGVEETGVALLRDSDNGGLGTIGGDQHSPRTTAEAATSLPLA